MWQWMRERHRLLWIVGSVVFGTTILGWWFWCQPFGRNTSTAPLAALSMSKSMEAHPRWKRYEKLTKDIKTLEEKLKSLGLLSTEQTGAKSSESEMNFSAGEQMLLRSEMELQLELMTETGQRWEKDLRDEVSNKMKVKEELLKEEIKADIEERQRLYHDKLISYKQEVDLEYSLKLTNIEFKKSVPGLSEEEKMILDNEATEIKRTVESSMKSKEAEYAQELKAFLDRRRVKAKEEMEDYLHQLQGDARRRMELQQKRLQQDLKDWQKERLEDHRQSMESKKLRYAVELNSLQSLRAEQDLLRIRMNSDIRRKARELAEKEGFSAVVLTPLYVLEKNDLTSGLIDSYK